MPTSDAQGREWVVEVFQGINPLTVVDVGPGEGTYVNLLRQFQPSAFWIAVEIWEPYVERFRLNELYEHIAVMDVMDYEWPEVDLVILGDVVEHLQKNDAILLLSELKQKVKHIIVSLPIVESIQGECEGNPYEAHVAQWGFDEMLEVMTPCHAWRGDVLGRYWWSKDRADGC